MNKYMRRSLIAALGVVPVGLLALPTVPAFAHGATGDPIGRSLSCSLEGWNPSNEACKAALKISDGQIGDWQSVVQGAAFEAGKAQHRALIPDGKLCSANSSKHAGLDLPRTDWKTTDLPAGKEYTLKYQLSVKHNPYRMEFYVTKDGFDANKPLKWSDLEAIPFASADNTIASPSDINAGAKTQFEIPATLPEKKGKHMIYAIWHGLVKPDGSVQSPEAFYSCSDVNFK
ncbi:lytic polysaccharide monooxygenase [Streptomyces sp. x-80]|uniref:lytic polysaccharide monooxygenase auxiliary activity family 9 protein n=1 Tax=Streptomyces sp. x-80 TaxID=2789282 RepID=UPI003980AF81